MDSFQLPLARYRFSLRAHSPIQFPAYSGSTWRGAFGTALRKAACLVPNTECKACLLQDSCVYNYIFNTPTTSNSLLSQVKTAPNPYMFHPERTAGKFYQTGETFDVDITLLGNALNYLPYVVYVLQMMGQLGLGHTKGQCELLHVAHLQDWLEHAVWHPVYVQGGSIEASPMVELPAVPVLPERIQVTLHSPLRLMQENKLIRSERLSFHVFFQGLIRRISLLHSHHAGTALQLDFKMLSDCAMAVALEQVQLEWFEWARYSNRQHSKVKMDGLLGQFELTGEQLSVFWKYLWWGQWIHVGKGTVMGMGEYSLALVENVGV